MGFAASRCNFQSMHPANIPLISNQGTFYISFSDGRVGISALCLMASRLLARRSPRYSKRSRQPFRNSSTSSDSSSIGTTSFKQPTASMDAGLDYSVDKLLDLDKWAQDQIKEVR